MLLTVLSVPECPNVKVMLDRLHNLLSDAGLDLDADLDSDVQVVVVDDAEHARGWGMTGSPTLLVDGVDPFHSSGTEASLSCRLYRGGKDGVVGGAPPLADLRDVLRSVADRAPVVGALVDGIGRGGRGRLAPRAGGLRAVQQGALRNMAESGTPPTGHHLDRIAEPFGRGGIEVLRELAREDYLTLDTTGGLGAAYPFSVEKTRHRVCIEGGPQLWAMCAVDALGVAPMLNRAVVIETTDPITAEAIHIDASADAAIADPVGTVVYLAGQAGVGPGAQTCCDSINFFGSRHSAARWAALHPEVRGEIVSLVDAARLGQAIFKALLAG